ncbi:LysM domain receptor-like kinase 3 [Abeliophyllum distichum]|uniref:LysM domain receptor-like kinase 3 n=1 Tax=Abeliophyllum distichum TaxID=126358 RepID=A0ABD1U3K6_9LAMI
MLSEPIKLNEQFGPSKSSNEHSDSMIAPALVAVYSANITKLCLLCKPITLLFIPSSNKELIPCYSVGKSGRIAAEDTNLTAGVDLKIHLLCGCVDKDSQVVVTYTVQAHDTVSSIANLLSAQVDEIEKLNPYLALNPSYIDIGWLLYVPMEKDGIPPPKKASKKGQEWTVIIGILAAVSLLSLCTLAIILTRRKRSQGCIEEDPKALSKTLSTNKSHSLQKRCTHKEKMEDIRVFESERPTLYSVEEIEEATSNFDETTKLGQGGYGSVYFGVLGEQRVLTRDHELGHQPLSWNARTQVALDAARGIEYIHDHTKAQYVHRDIKTSNILLDEGLRAKVADFGLAKLVGRTDEDELIATRLVGTPGYLPPESVKELQVTTKTDVFAFGVVLSELITGQRALIRDNQKMKSLITIVNKIFDEEYPEYALESIVDRNLNGSYPPQDVYRMAEIAHWCLSEEAIDRPEMHEVVVGLTRIRMSSTEWEASLGGSSQVFSGLFDPR